MNTLRSLPVRTSLAIAFILFSSLKTSAQTPNVPARVAQPVDLEQFVTLQGNTHPLARPEYDQGVAPDSLPMERILLVLQRSAEQESALRKLLDEQQIKASPNYHMWLTPEEFGQQFGPADADLQAVTDWLTSQGFQVNRVAAGRTIIEFSGTAGKVRQAFHTEIHKYVVKGEEHWANASDPQIPAGLKPVVAGFASLNNFPRELMIQRVGAFSRSKATGAVTPLFTVPTGSGNYYALAPTDFATIYNVLPIWQANPAGDGLGQTIAIVAGSNINVQDVQDFRSLFGLPANDPQIIVNGVDPGVTGGSAESEADLDTEWSGAVARYATIELVVSESTEATFGADLSAVYIVDNNLAPILSASYGGCEAGLGVGGNAFYNALWGQGAAQGITILVATGDNGSAGCDESASEAAAQYGLMVSGTASTPFNVAVGGTDFNDVNTWSTYWSSSNNSTTLASALSYIPETTWNNSCARAGIASNCASAGSDTPTGVDLIGGSGGASNCVTSTSTATSLTCQGGYPKPAWQSGSGVPEDGARDLPDVSLFASSGINNSFYAICQADALPAGDVSCNSSSAQWYFEGAGGTSASTPAFAGIMALVNQKNGGRQGNANYVLYPLAAKSGASCASSASMASTANNSNCIFYDVVTGNNSVACMGGTPNCSNTTSGSYGILEVNPPSNSTPAWTTTPGYDLATGLGSVNATNLVNKWSSVSFKPTTTTLTNLSPTTLTHGQAATFTVDVAPGSGSGTPAGNVSLIAQTGASSTNVTGIGPFTLSGGTVTSSTNMLPGGTYGVTAHYAGNGTYGASDSTPPIKVTVGTESSQTEVGVATCDYTSGACTYGVTSMVYGSTYGFLLLRMDVTNAGGQLCFSPATGLIAYPCPTGTVTATVNGLPPSDLGNPTDNTPGTYPLNSEGYTEDQYIQLPGGTYNIVVSYAGDNSYTASTSPQAVVTITKAPTTITGCTLPSSIQVGAPFNCLATVNTQSHMQAPTGTVQWILNGTPVGGGGDVQGTNGSATTYASFQETYYPTFQQGGTFSLVQQYSGDPYYASSTTSPATINISDFSVSPNPSTITIAAPGQSGTSLVTIAPVAGFTGTVALSCGTPGASMGCSISPSSVTLTNSSSATATLTITTGGASSASPPAVQRKTPFGSGLPLARFWLLAGLTILAAFAAIVARRSPVWLIAAALLMVGAWVACGGGGGGTQPPPPEPVVSLSPSSLAFGSQNVGIASASQSATLANTGNATLSITMISVAGTNAADFIETNSTCGNSVGPGLNCTISVAFDPTATGARSASLSINDNLSGSPPTISLTGTGVGAPAVTLSPSTLSFGQQVLGTASGQQAVTVTNSGNALLTLTGVYLYPAGDPNFNVYNGCDSTPNLLPGANCSIPVSFTPTVSGPLSATLSINDNATGSPQTASLTGTGVLAPTSPGTYTVQVGAVNGGDTHYANVQVNVQ